jgi:hypothetical protein
MAQSRDERRYKFGRTPTKGVGDREQRVNQQKKRVLALGVSEAQLKHLNVQQIRHILQHPTRFNVKSLPTVRQSAHK